MAQIKVVDFEWFIALEDEVATCNEPDPHEIIQMRLTEVQTAY